MKYNTIIAIVLSAVILLSGCGSAAAVSDRSEEAGPIASSTEAAQTEEGESAQAETTGPSDGNAQAEFAGPTEPQLFEFQPHLYSALLAGEIPQDHWDSLYHLSDALRMGEDTFECSSQEAYDWCMDAGTLAHLIPAACMKITGESDDGTVPYEDGVGRIYYKMPAEEYVARQAEFEQMVADVLNSTIQTDDDDYEKCIKLYDYMACNYDYQYEFRTDEESEDGYIYLTFMTHEGQCIDLGGLYAFLLLQAGVDALSVGSYDNLDHEWTYAIVNGQGYHIDPTWALKTSRYSDSLYLDYFMMNDEIRSETGCPVKNLTVQLLPQFFVERSSLTLPATDDRYYLGDFSAFESLDEENKILHYLDMDEVEHELHYGELSSNEYLSPMSVTGTNGTYDLWGGLWTCEDKLPQRSSAPEVFGTRLYLNSIFNCFSLFLGRPILS